MNRRFALLPAWVIAAATLTGCAGPAPSDYAAQKPTLDLNTDFNGELTAHGIFTDRWSGRADDGHGGIDLVMYCAGTYAEAAVEIEKGWRKGEFEIYFPKRFTLWLKGLRHLGYGAYFALVRRSTGL